MDANIIIERVETTIDKVKGEFRENATQYFTENDIVMYFYSQLQNELGYLVALDKDCNKHFLVHGEYPTPVKLDMKGINCEVKENKSRHKRGHFDIIVLNPDFINAHSYDEIKAQTFKMFREIYENSVKPVALYGLEFMLSRDEFNSKSAEENFWNKTLQDATKLDKMPKEFMGRKKMLAFIKGTKMTKHGFIEKQKILSNIIEIIWEDKE
ncbi:MAG: hypothetical protein NTZ10_00430 [Candidatus Saganbacteria bacterium]|nr:hypothetical protein [Candidatus Saganbacteria bacterium]